MKTRLVTSPTEAAAFIRTGGIVAFPTETVYGLGADAVNEAAIAKIFEAKRRPADNPLIAHISRPAEIDRLAKDVTAAARKIIDAFFPGPLTVVLPKAGSVPAIATAGLDTIGIRMPRHPIARDFLLACERPVVAPSANLSGRPSPTTWRAVLEDLDGRIDCILQGEATEIGLESTVVDCSGERPVLLRKGAISIDALREVVPDIAMSAADDEGARRSPGMLHRHYTPRAAVFIIEHDVPMTDRRDAYIGLTPRYDSFMMSRQCTSVEDYAASLFEFFRECDRAGVERIFCEAVSEEGIGAALMDRLERAAARD